MKPEQPNRLTRKPLAELNIVPLLDVLLVLVAVLLLLTPYMTRALPVEVPAVGVSGLPVVSNTLTVVLKPGMSDFLVGESVLTVDALLVRVGPETSVEIVADNSVPYGDVARLLALLRTRSPQNIYLAVQ